jgi:uncharacterized protein YlxW (UPF0749 family)
MVHVTNNLEQLNTTPRRISHNSAVRLDTDNVSNADMAPDLKYRVTSKGLLKKSHAFVYFCVPIVVLILIVIVVIAVQSQQEGDYSSRMTDQLETQKDQITKLTERIAQLESTYTVLEAQPLADKLSSLEES